MAVRTYDPLKTLAHEGEFIDRLSPHLTSRRQSRKLSVVASNIGVAATNC